jgi:hypothetical protein
MRGYLTCRTFVMCLGAGLLACGVASAQWVSPFEPPTYTGSPEGTGLAGQDLFYIPEATTPSTDCFVYTYEGNVLGIPDNPGGGAQFVGATGLGDGSYARGQRTEEGTWGDQTGVWTASFDIAAAFLGTPPTADNLGSWSSQPLDDPLAPTQCGFITLVQWTDPAIATNWEANYLAYDAAGTYMYPATPADPAFHHLPLNHWYRWSTTVDFDTNMIRRIAITDLATGGTVSEEPVEWYLAGGAAGGLPGPTGLRFFAGCGSYYGNTLAFDNVAICPFVSGDLDWDGDVDLSDLAQLLANYGMTTGATYEDGDLNGDGDVDLTDLAQLLAQYGATCP